MRCRDFALVLAGVFTLIGCKTTVQTHQSARDVEVLSQGYLHGDRKENCREVAKFDVVVAENEQSGSKTQSIAEVKARNEAASRGATHVLLWPETDQACNDKGELAEDGEKVCQVSPVTAYECVVGLST